MNIREFFHSTIRNTVSTSTNPTGVPICFKCGILCAYDMRKELDWDEIDGVRRVVEMRFYSDAVNLLNGTNYFVRRVFTYKLASPRDLLKITDTLVSL